MCKRCLYDKYMLFNHFYLMQGKNRSPVCISNKQRIHGVEPKLVCQQIDKKTEKIRTAKHIFSQV